MTYIVLIIILFSGIIFFLVKFLNSPKIHKNIPYKSLPEYLNILLYRGFDSGFMIINSKKNKCFLQFKKYIIKKGDVYLELGFPLADWAKQYYNKLHAVLKKNQIKYHISPKSNDYELEFTYVNCGMDIKLCQKLIKIIFLNVFDYNENELFFNVKFENVSPEDTKIGF